MQQTRNVASLVGRRIATLQNAIRQEAVQIPTKTQFGYLWKRRAETCPDAGKGKKERPKMKEKAKTKARRTVRENAKINVKAKVTLQKLFWTRIGVSRYACPTSLYSCRHVNRRRHLSLLTRLLLLYKICWTKRLEPLQLESLSFSP